MTAWEVGQKVILRDVNQDRRWWPAGDPPMGTITKVGRTLLHVTDDRYPSANAETYRMDDGTRNNNWGHGWVQTIAQFKAERDRSLILGAFREVGLSLSGHERLTNDQLERMLVIAGGTL